MKMFALCALATTLLAAGCGPGFYDRPIKEADRTVKEVSLRGNSTNDGTYARAELSVVNASPLAWDVTVACRWYTDSDLGKDVSSARTAFTVPPWTRRYFAVSGYAPTRVSHGIGRDSYTTPTPLAFGLRMRCEMEKMRHVNI
ncbi:MAG: hypothetical protein AAB562_03495 [Patescibacteria group bacterium]